MDTTDKELAINYADEAMFEAAPMGGSGTGTTGTLPSVHLLSATPDPLGAIAAACRMYEGKTTYDLADITDDERKHYWEQANATHLKAPLEFVDLHFFIEGVDRAFTHQMVRQRTAVYAQESLRFAVKDDLAAEASLPPSLQGTLPGGQDTGVEAHGPPEAQQARDVWDTTLAEVEAAYHRLVGMGMPAEDARGLLPHCTTTRLNYKTNLRNLLDHAGNRLCTQAQFAWRLVFAQIVQAIRGHHVRGLAGLDGWQWKLIADSAVFKPVCYQLGHCPFTADFDRGCTIRDRVQAGEWGKIDDTEWLADPTAAVVQPNG